MAARRKVDMATYLITGGCGFIGSHLADALLADGHQVRILDDLSSGIRENSPASAELVVGDVIEAAAVGAAIEGVDGCFHLAAVASVQRAHNDWLGAHRVNLDGTIQVFNSARSAGAGGSIPVVYASSAAVYGDNPDVPLTETASTRPLSAYGADKLGCEMHAKVAGQVYGVPTTGLRFFNVFGPRQDPSSPYSGVISIFADRLLKGQKITIHGDSQQVRDFVFVDDAVCHLVAAMDKASTKGGVYNVCGGLPSSVNNLAQVLSSICGAPLGMERAPDRLGDIRASLGDPAAAIAALGTRAEVELDDGLKRTVHHLTRATA